MKPAQKFHIVLTTAPDLKVARRIAQKALTGRLVACANLLPSAESHYWWQGNIEKSSEVLVLMKTTKTRLAALEKLIIAWHPYEVPEFIVLPLTAGNSRYLDWIAESVADRPR